MEEGDLELCFQQVFGDLSHPKYDHIRAQIEGLKEDHTALKTLEPYSSSYNTHLAVTMQQVLEENPYRVSRDEQARRRQWQEDRSWEYFKRYDGSSDEGRAHRGW